MGKRHENPGVARSDPGKIGWAKFPEIYFLFFGLSPGPPLCHCVCQWQTTRAKRHTPGIRNVTGSSSSLSEKAANAEIRRFHLPQHQRCWDGVAVPRLHGMETCRRRGDPVQFAILANALATCRSTSSGGIKLQSYGRAARRRIDNFVGRKSARLGDHIPGYNKPVAPFPCCRRE